MGGGLWRRWRLCVGTVNARSTPAKLRVGGGAAGSRRCVSGEVAAGALRVKAVRKLASHVRHGLCEG